MDPFLLFLATGVALLGLVAVALSGRMGLFWLGFLSTLVPLEFIDRYYISLPASIKWLPEIGLTSSGLAAAVLYPRVRAWIPRRLWVAYALFLAHSVVSMLVNGSPPAALLVAQRGFILFFAAMTAMKVVYDVYDKDRILRLLVGAGLASALFCFVQRVTIGAGEGDRVTGLFSVGYITLFYHLVCLGIAMSYWTRGRRILPSVNSAVVVLLLVLALAVANQKAALPFFVLILIYLFFRAGARRGALMVVGLLLPGVLLIVFTAIYDFAYQAEGEASYARAIFRRDYVQRYLFGEEEDVHTPGGSLLRGAAIQFAYREMSDGPRHLVFGRGPGATSASRLAGATGELALRFREIDRVMLALLLGDVGFLGLFLYSVFLLAVRRCRPPDDVREPREHALARELVVFLSFTYFVYARMCYEPSYAWLLAAVLYPLRPAPGVRAAAPAPS